MKAYKYPNKYTSLLKAKTKTFTKTYRPYLYGAYGSNLNMSQMQLRCPLAKKIGVVRLPDYELVFRGVADIAHKADAEIMLGIWQITDQCESSLDVYEGFPRLYGKKVFDINAGHFEALYDRDIDIEKNQKLLVYQMIDQTEIYRPNQHYLQSIAKGFVDFGIRKDAIEIAVQNSYTHETLIDPQDQFSWRK